MVSVFASATLAFLLVGGRRAGSLLPECPGNYCIQRVPLLRCNAIALEPYNQKRKRQTKILDLRQRQAVLVREFQGLVRAKRNSAPFWRRGKEGSIAVIERFIGSLKSECMDVILVPIQKKAFRRELALFSDWYNRHRPHSALREQTPTEIHNGMKPAGRRSRFEPRARWPTGTSSQTPASGERGNIVRLEVTHHSGRCHLPIVALKRAA